MGLLTKLRWRSITPSLANPRGCSLGARYRLRRLWCSTAGNIKVRVAWLWSRQHLCPSNVADLLTGLRAKRRPSDGRRQSPRRRARSPSNISESLAWLRSKCDLCPSSVTSLLIRLGSEWWPRDGRRQGPRRRARSPRTATRLTNLWNRWRQGARCGNLSSISHRRARLRNSRRRHRPRGRRLGPA